MSDAWTGVQETVRELDLLKGALAALHWDQQTYLPSGAGGLRGEQLATLSKVLHQRATAPAFGDLLEDAHAHATDATVKTATTRLLDDYHRATRLPDDLVGRMARAEANGFEAWMKAKESDDYATFLPALDELLDLAKEKADAIDSDGHPLQVLMDEFDPGVDIRTLQTTFARLQGHLTELIEATRDAEPRRIQGDWSVEVQRSLHERIATALGYDRTHGRLDLAEHPFTISLGHDDVRITTHLYEHDLLSGIGGTVHETGHALYEQGLPASLAGTGLDEAASFGLHESQSRFWENAIGRSLAFFEWLKPQLDQAFPGNAVSAHDLYRAANRIEPGFIRVAADEVTYNLHIIARVELELALFEGRLTTADLPAAWNDKYTQYLGITPPNDTLGVLQDVHWATGAFAYFQSYTLGNLYAAAFDATLRAEMPDLDDRVRAGDFAPILAWLRDNIHQHGRTKTGAERVHQVVGERDYVADLSSYLWSRHGALYGLTVSA